MAEFVADRRKADLDIGSEIRRGQVDTNRARIQAHGGSILYLDGVLNYPTIEWREEWG
jgi:hypothetical protein